MAVPSVCSRISLLSLSQGATMNALAVEVPGSGRSSAIGRTVAPNRVTKIVERLLWVSLRKARNEHKIPECPYSRTSPAALSAAGLGLAWINVQN